jgi:hypothetical protein
MSDLNTIKDELFSMISQKGEWSYPGVKLLAEKLGSDIQTTSRAIIELLKEKLASHSDFANPEVQTLLEPVTREVIGKLGDKASFSDIKELVSQDKSLHFDTLDLRVAMDTVKVKNKVINEQNRVENLTSNIDKILEQIYMSAKDNMEVINPILLTAEVDGQHLTAIIDNKEVKYKSYDEQDILVETLSLISSVNLVHLTEHNISKSEFNLLMDNDSALKLRAYASSFDTNVVNFIIPEGVMFIPPNKGEAVVVSGPNLLIMDDYLDLLDGSMVLGSENLAATIDLPDNDFLARPGDLSMISPIKSSEATIHTEDEYLVYNRRAISRNDDGIVVVVNELELQIFDNQMAQKLA